MNWIKLKTNVIKRIKKWFIFGEWVARQRFTCPRMHGWRELERKRDERDQLLPTVQSITALGEVEKSQETENRGQPPVQLPQTICLQEFVRERRYNTILIFFFFNLNIKVNVFFFFPVNGSVFLSVEFHVKN